MPSSRTGLAVTAAVVVIALAVVVALLVAGGSSDQAQPSPTATEAVGGSAGGPGGATPSGSTLSPAEQTLVDLLDPFELRRCVSAEVAEAELAAAGLEAAVVCEAEGVERVHVARYVDDGALDADVARRAGSIDDDLGRCRQGEDSVEDWGRNNRQLGTLLCWTVAEQAGVFWTYDEHRIGFEVSGDDSTLDAAALIAWWDEREPATLVRPV